MATAANVHAAVGRTAGTFEVSPTGAATYRIPLWVSPGAGGVQPSLGLVYNSQSGNGIMGPGWSLAGLSAITRCPKTFAQDSAPSAVTLTYSDAFCLDGKRLRITSGALSTYGQAGTTYETEIADFTLVTAVGANGNGPQSFEAKTKSGLILEFGNTADSRITPSASIPTAYMWLVNKIRDHSGNSLVVTYGTGAAGSVGIGVPASISYSPTSAGGSSYVNSVTFEYGPKVGQVPNTTDPAIVGYVSGTQVVNTNLLLAINAYSSGTLVRRYSMAYEAAPTTTRARLASVTECAGTTGTDCLAPTTIDYQDGSAGVSTSGIPVVSGSTSFIGTPDVNGDGREDLLFSSASGVMLSFSFGAGFSSPFPIASSGSYVVHGDIAGTGRSDILIAQSGTWVRYSWTGGQSFNTSSTGISVPADISKAGLLDVDGDGREDFVITTKSFVSTPRSYHLAVVTYPNTSTGGSASFGSPVTSYSRTVNCGVGLPPGPCTADLLTGMEWRSGVRMFDFNGDGRNDLALKTTRTVADELISGISFVISNGSTFTESGESAESYDFVGFALLNDDNCTDVVLTRSIYISRCDGQTASSVSLPADALSTIDWNSDGHTDVLLNGGANYSVALANGTGVTSPIPTSIPLAAVPRNVFVVDAAGDGLDALGTWGSGIVFYPNSSAGVPPDLVSSITDGYGVKFNPTYVSIANDDNYAKAPDGGLGAAAYPLRDYEGPLFVVTSFTATSGASSPSMYTTWMNYLGARVDVSGRGFAGFMQVSSTDGRNQLVREVRSKTEFPYTGMPLQVELRSVGALSPISRTLYVSDRNELEAGANNQRYFPYISTTTTYEYEVGGPLDNGTPFRTVTRNSSFDSYGNETNVVVAASSTQFGGNWTSTTTRTITPDTSNWCLNQPTQISVSQGALFSVPTLTRTTSYTVDYSKCRVTAETIEPGDSRWQVSKSYGYDGFGNVNEVTVTPAAGQGQAARTSYFGWGSTGRFVESVTNALSQTTTFGWDHGLGVRTSVTDPNMLTTSWQYDAFGRMTRETRPDGTATVHALSACNAGNNYCDNADLRSQVQTTLRSPTDDVIRTDNRYFDLFDRPRLEIGQLFGNTYRQTGRTYDALGRVATETIPHLVGDPAYSTTYFYDVIGRPYLIRRPTSASDPTNHDTAISYQGLTTVYTDAENRTTSQRRNSIGLVVQAWDAAGADTEYEYDAFGNLTKTRDVAGNEIVLTYNIRGMKMTSSDPDMGDWSYDYYPLGELKSQTDAKNQTATFTYDALSRMTTRTEAEGVSTWTWGASSTAHNIGQLEAVSSPGYSEAFVYDDYGRLSSRQIVSDATYQYNYGYDSATGFMNSLVYPTSTANHRLSLQYVYQNGLLHQVKEAGGTTYWQGNALNAFGQVTQEALGNGIVTNRAIDAVTGLLSSLQSGPGGGAARQNESYLFDRMGNLTQRQNNNLGLTENFHYDVLDRLDYSMLGSVTNLDLSYDALGNITSRSDVANGATWVYHATKKHAVVQAGSYTYGYDANGNVTNRNGHSITWTSYNYPSVVNDTGKTLTFDYGPDRQRFRQVYTTTGSSTETTIYIGELLEKVTVDGVTDWRHKIVAGKSGIAIVSRKSSGTNTTRYLLRDHLGSIADILDDTGASFVSESFAAFGARRDPDTWSGPCPCPDLQKIKSVSRRGFTDHEMIGGQSMGLIHMNGRVLDSNIGRFISADPFIQDPSHSQALNRYSYGLNNPLSKTDPSGFMIRCLGCTWSTVWQNPSGGQWHSQSAVLIQPDGDVINLGTRWVYEPGGGNSGAGASFNFGVGGSQPASRYRDRPARDTESNGHSRSPAGETGISDGAIAAVAAVGRYVGSYGTEIASSSAVRGALAVGLGTSVADGPLPAGEVIGGTIILAVTAGVVVDKAADDIAGLVESTRTWAQRPGEVYTLRAGAAGFYPDLRTGSMTFLNAGEIWKIGESVNGSGRYSSSFYNALGIDYQTEYVGGQLQIKIMEKQLLMRYVLEHGRLPPGNRIFR